MNQIAEFLEALTVWYVNTPQAAPTTMIEKKGIVRSAPKCEIVSAEILVSTGQNFTSSTLGCWSEYSYVLLQPGTIQVQLTLNWSTGMSTTGA